MEDQQIIKLYFDRNEQALAETDRKYGGYCYSLAHAILKNREDAEETVNDTWLRTWNAIPPQIPKVLRLFLAKITRNLAFNTYKAQNAQKRGGGEMVLVLEELDGCIPAPGSVVEDLEAKELGRIIQAFLETQPRRERGIFVSRYFFVEETEVIAQRYGITPGNARQILNRTRIKLKEHLTKEGYAV